MSKICEGINDKVLVACSANCSQSITLCDSFSPQLYSFLLPTNSIKSHIKMVPSHNLFYFLITYLIKPLIELANCRKIFWRIQDNHLICDSV